MEDLKAVEKVNLFLEEIQKQGIEVGYGDTAFICNDGVVIVSAYPEKGGMELTVIANRQDMDYDLGITKQDVKDFRLFSELGKELCKGDANE